jgi:uncharacterized protein YPO0396
MTEEDVEEIQRPDRILTQTQSVGTPSEKGVRKNIASLRKEIKANKDWLIQRRRQIQKAKESLSKLAKQIGC